MKTFEKRRVRSFVSMKSAVTLVLLLIAVSQTACRQLTPAEQADLQAYRRASLCCGGGP